MKDPATNTTRLATFARPAVASCRRNLPLLLLTLMLSAAWLSAQVPALVNYQGRVAVHGTNFGGNGLFKFALVNSNGTVSFWSHDDTSSGGNEPGSAVPLAVAGGLFSVNLGDRSVSNMTSALPAWVFTNTDVRLRLWFNDGVSGSQQLSPDQRITSAAYALMAGGVPSGVITSQMLAPGAVSSNALAANAISTLNILDGTLTDADLSTNARINASKIVGGDLMATRLKVGTNHLLTGTLATIAGGTNNTASGEFSAVGGGYINSAKGNSATVAGGSMNSATNTAATVGGGYLNTAGGFATVAGGSGNTAAGLDSFIGGGERNTIQTNSTDAVVAGGADNVILANAQLATISGGYQNINAASTATIGGGRVNAIRTGADYSTIAGGVNNGIQTNASTSAIGGGDGNSIQTDAGQSTIAGGYYNAIQKGAVKSSIGGGHGNDIKTNAVAATIAGGYENTAEAYATVSGGSANTAGGASSVIGGGGGNTASGYISTIGGGYQNTASGWNATVPGGELNTASGGFSFAAGRRAKALHDGSFVWADGTGADVTSTGPNQFVIRAGNGVQLANGTPLRFGSSGQSGLWADQGGAIELGDSSLIGTTPFIDFHYGVGEAQDNNVRLINDADGQLTCYGRFHAVDRYLVVEGLGNDQAYLGGDGAGGDVEFGSLNPNIDIVSFWNPTTGKFMRAACCALTITGGCDISEPFQVSSKDIPKGAVVVIDEKNPGALKLSDQPYDKRVAGVISGANGVNPGLTLSQKGVLDGDQQVALTGRVYVQADASHGAIEPGDLLTTSATPGHAMKVTDQAQAPGAVLGKAMSALKEGQGLVLVLVSLQ